MTARQISLRQASLQSQRTKAASIEHTKARSAARKLQRAMATPTKAAEMRPADQRGFSQWWRTFYGRGLLDGLSEDEVGAVHTLAWNHYHAVHPTNAWRDAVAALVARHKAAQPPEPANYWRRGSADAWVSNPRDEGW